MATINDKSVFEQANSPTFSLAMDGRETCQVVIHCAWADWPAVWTGLKANGGMQCPHRDYLWCRDIAVEPIPAKATAVGDPGEKWNSYQLAKLTIQFASPGYELPQYVTIGALQILVSERTEPTIEAVQLPIAARDGSALFEWASDDEELKEGENPIRQVYGIDYQQSHHNILESAIGATYNILANVLAVMGKVNDANLVTWLLGGLTFAPETLLCKPPILESAGTGLVTIHYRFKGNPEGWNKFWRPDKLMGESPNEYYGGYDTIQIAGETEPYRNHPLGDFSGL